MKNEKGVIVDAFDLKLGKEVFYYCELGKIEWNRWNLILLINLLMIIWVSTKVIEVSKIQCSFNQKGDNEDNEHT